MDKFEIHQHFTVNHTLLFFLICILQFLSMEFETNYIILIIVVVQLILMFVSQVLSNCFARFSWCIGMFIIYSLFSIAKIVSGICIKT